MYTCQHWRYALDSNWQDVSTKRLGPSCTTTVSKRRFDGSGSLGTRASLGMKKRIGKQCSPWRSWKQSGSEHSSLQRIEYEGSLNKEQWQKHNERTTGAAKLRVQGWKGIREGWKSKANLDEQQEVSGNQVLSDEMQACTDSYVPQAI